MLSNISPTVSVSRRLPWEVYGFDSGKLVKGRKRHLVVDSQGLVIGVLVSEANLSERIGAIVVLDEAREELSQTEVIWVDGGYWECEFCPSGPTNLWSAS